MSLVAWYNAVREGTTVTFRPRGSSMKGLVPDGALVEVTPCNPASLEVGDVVLVKVAGSIYLHKVTAVSDGRVQIGNNRGRINGWAKHAAVAGLCTAVEGAQRPRIEGKTR